ncbi:unnamed protein product [Ambrosiozyma monospora]|uniref:Unnamed protein product n=1 Tax=Ambrosiozyma monospora TaxID=43982 RepID=A0A9W6YST9_AMBMO|nr:unnamed protein product [Ambrosiozyma monospora]
MAASKIITTSTTTSKVPKKTKTVIHVPIPPKQSTDVNLKQKPITNHHPIKLDKARKITKLQKARIIERTKQEIEQRKTEFKNSIQSEKSDLKLRLENRLNKILRRFWDFKINDILNLERELKGLNHVTLATVLRELQSVGADVAATTGGAGGGSSSDKENRRERVKR